jgi:hypothetical protein
LTRTGEFQIELLGQLLPQNFYGVKVLHQSRGEQLFAPARDIVLSVEPPIRRLLDGC